MDINIGHSGHDKRMSNWTTTG